MKPRIGRKMQAAVEYVKRHPGCTKYAVAKAIGPLSTRNHGIGAVENAIRAGLIENRGKIGDQYSLYVKEE